MLALRDRKRPAEWCRDKVLEALKASGPSVAEYAIMAEICALEAILIDLIYTWSHDGKLTQKAVQEIVHSAQRSKFKEASKLFLAATSRLPQSAAPESEETEKASRV